MRVAGTRDSASLFFGGMMSDAEAPAEPRKHSEDEGPIFSKRKAVQDRSIVVSCCTDCRKESTILLSGSGQAPSHKHSTDLHQSPDCSHQGVKTSISCPRTEHCFPPQSTALAGCLRVLTFVARWLNNGERTVAEAEKHCTRRTSMQRAVAARRQLCVAPSRSWMLARLRSTSTRRLMCSPVVHRRRFHWQQVWPSVRPSTRTPANMQSS